MSHGESLKRERREDRSRVGREEDNIVIVGARIAGVATAVSLQRQDHRPNSQTTRKDVLD